MALDDETLRAAASHRGLKLIKSRRRKAGVGDYGRYGLADAAGNPLFGIDGDTLTATPQAIADYLRKGEASTWAESAKATPAREPRSEPTSRVEDDEAEPAIRARPAKTTRAAASIRPTARPAELPRSTPPREVESEPEPEPVPEPQLSIRPARRTDAEPVRDLLALTGFDGTTPNVARAIAAAAARKEPVLVADRGGVVGCLAWHVIPALQHGPIVRITALVVAKDDRRSGIGRALFDAATDEFATHHVERVEAMSDIAVRNANAFYRALGLEQASYRFTRSL